MAVSKTRSSVGDVVADDAALVLGPYPRWVRVELVREARAGAYRTWILREPEDVALILEPLLRREPTETFVVCLLSHLADMANPSPQMLWWPLSRRTIHPRWLPAAREASPVGRWIEHGVVLVAIIGALALWGGRPV